jgi:hypothetical protein
MVGVILAGIVLGAAALVLAKGRKRPAPRPVPVEVNDRKDPRRR